MSLYEPDPPNPSIPHYYGDAVRRFFLAGGLIMLITLPFFAPILPIPLFLSLLAILFCGVFAGFMNPQQKWVIILNTVIAIVALIIFEYYAVEAYRAFGSVRDGFFIISQVLALNFFLATYYSAKTLRGIYLRKGQLHHYS